MRRFNALIITLAVGAVLALIAITFWVKQTITYQVEVTYLDTTLDTLSMSRTGRDLRDTAPWLSQHGCVLYYNHSQACGVRTFRVINKTITKQ